MINWFLVAVVPLASILGAELGRRRMEARKEIYSFQPRWLYRLLSAVGIATGVLFIEAARVTLSDPSDYHIWTLILAAGISWFCLVALGINEYRGAKRRIDELSVRPID